MQITIDDAQRAELLAAVIDRKATIAGHVKKLIADTMPEEAALAERRLALYITQTGAGGKVGLVAMFSIAPDLDEEHVRAGEERDSEGQQDIFGGGSETGGGHPAGEVESLGHLGAFGKLYDTPEAAEASFRTGPETEAPSEERVEFRALPPGTGDDAEYTVELVEEHDAGDTGVMGLGGEEHDGDADAEETSPGADQWDQGAGAHREPAAD